MKIAIITSNFPPKLGGISHTTNNVYKYLRKEHDIFIYNDICDNPPEKIYNLVQNSGKYELNLKIIKLAFRLIKCLLLKSKSPFFLRLTPFLHFIKRPRDYLKLLKSVELLSYHFKTKKFDLIVSTNVGFTTQIAFFLSQIFKVKAVILAHGDDFIANMRRINHYINTAYLSAVHGIIFSNDIMKNLFLKLYPSLRPIKMHNINRAINLDDCAVKEDKQILRDEFKISQQKFVLISVGRLILRKNYQNVIKALKLIRDERNIDSLLYLIIGEGPAKKNLEELIIQNELEKNVLLLGGIKSEKMKNKYLKMSDIFLMPSYYDRINKSIEGFGINFLEANFYKLPTIGSFSGGIPKAIDNGKSGFLINSQDVNGLKEKILVLLNNKDLKNTMGEYGHKRTVDYFSWDKIYLDYVKIFEETIRN